MVSINSSYNMSTLFSSIKTDNAMSGIYGSLSDYKTINTGSYQKLLKKYYNSDTDTKNKLSSVNSNLSTSKSDSSEIKDVRSSVTALKNASNELMSKDLFVAGKDGLDKDKIYDAVNDFVNNYNKVIDKASDTASSTINSSVNSMANTTKANSKMLGNMGIKIGSDNKLSIDKDAFMKADMNTVKSMFNSMGSFGYQAGVSASMIDYAAQNEAAKSNTYTSVGNYSYNYNAGSLFNYGL